VETFPVVDGIPVLLDERRSAFSTEAFLAPDARTGPSARRMRRLAKKLVPDISHNLASADNYRALVSELRRTATAPYRVLVIGGSIAGQGFGILAGERSVDLVETDVAFGPRTQVVCDGHALPFADGVFHAVVCQAVLEHVADPPRVVSEIHRVLRTEGLVYSEIPFMQQVHEGVHDFTRYTLIGHRRLYRQFECLRSGVTAGPGTALAWSIKYLMLSFTNSDSLARDIITASSNYLLFWLKYLDYALLRFRAASDGASGTYLLGRRSDRTVSDRELLSGAGGDGAGFRLVRG
jgi:SAM-dependent methyltransferase